jgi:hypothetical protein
MDLFEISKLKKIDEKRGLSVDEFRAEYFEKNKPVVITGVADKWDFLKSWTLENLGEKIRKVKIQRPSEYGVYHFMKFDEIGYGEFLKKIKNKEDVYLSANQILGEGGVAVNEDSFGRLTDDLTYLEYIRREEIFSANLWIGPGGNKTLLHFDPWHSFIVVVKGKKRVAVYHPSQTPYLNPFKMSELKSMYEGRMMDSKINPEAVQEEYIKDARNAEGAWAEVKKGQILYIPAGAWHYVKSYNVNISINYFYNAREEGLLDKPPLKDYYLKKKYIVPVMEKIRQTKGALAAVKRRVQPGR